MKITAKKRSREVYQMTIPTPFLVGPVNIYLIKGEVLTLVDTGPRTDEALTELTRQLSELNVSVNDIELVVLTHHHPDHIGLIQEFLPKAKVVGHRKTRPWLEKDREFFKRTRDYFYQFYQEHGVPKEWVKSIDRSYQYYLDFTTQASLDAELVDKGSIDGLSGWRVIETPGHSQSHVSIIREEDGIMIAGDHLIDHISSNAIIEAPYGEDEARPKTLLQYRESLLKCLNATTIYSGHGVVIEDPKQLINDRLKGQLEKAQVFKRKMGDNPIQVFDLCKMMYPQIYQKQTSLTFSETLGHFDLLEENQEIESFKVDDKIYYKRIY